MVYKVTRLRFACGPAGGDGVNRILQLLSEETEARGDITKEALTPGCDITKQTSGPRRAWETAL